MLKLAICEDDVIQCEQIQCLTQSSLRIPFEFDIFSSAKGFLKQISNKNIYSLCNFHEKLIIELLIFALNYLFYKNVVSLLKECINYLKFTLLLLITFPVFLPLIATEVIHYAAFTNHFIPVFLYIICCFISILLFIHALNVFKKEQANLNRNLHKIELLKKQLEMSEEMKQEYTKIRKWNHDIENHLLSLAYLTDMKKTEEAEKYCISVLQNTSNQNKLTPANQEDSVL